MRYDNGVEIPWAFSQRGFARFITELEELTTWKYSGDADLIIMTPELTFSDFVVFDIERMQTDGAIQSASQLLEAVIRFAETGRAESASTTALSNRAGVRVFGESVVDALLELIPKPFRGLWKKGIHYRTQNIARTK